MLLNAEAQNGAPVLLSNSYQHEFSDRTKNDRFKLILTGKTILTGKVLFQIITSGHQTIYSETFPASDLYGDMDAYFTNKQKQDAIQARFKAFFNTSVFKLPAIDRKEQYDEDNYDKSVFKEIKSDPTAIGFIYSHGYEGTYGIVWLKKQKKVVKYFFSD